MILFIIILAFIAAVIAAIFILAVLINIRQIRSEQWTDIRRVGPIPIPWHAYRVTDDRLYERLGLVRTTEKETFMYLITDVRLERTLIQRLCGTGTVVVISRDEDTKTMLLQGVKNYKQIKQRISDSVYMKMMERPEVIMR